jgi:hypothetical protein
MKGRAIPTWQVVLSDLALILFLTTLAALARTPGEEPVPVTITVTETDRSSELAVYRDGAGGLTLIEWLMQQQPDPRIQVTVLGRFAPTEFAAVSRRARELALQSEQIGRPPRLVLEPADTSVIVVSLAYDAPELLSHAQTTRLRPDSLAR